VGLIWVVALVASGCSSRASATKTYKVTGNVVSKSGRSLGGGSVQFAHLSDTTITASGDIGRDGAFALNTVKGSEKLTGAPEGEYRVTILFPIGGDQRVAPPLVLPNTYRVEPRDNHFPIEIDAPSR
jgi:hypothetical protein